MLIKCVAISWRSCDLLPRRIIGSKENKIITAKDPQKLRATLIEATKARERNALNRDLSSSGVYSLEFIISFSLPHYP